MTTLLLILTLCAIGGLYWYIQQIAVVEEYERQKVGERMDALESEFRKHELMHDARDKAGWP